MVKEILVHNGLSRLEVVMEKMDLEKLHTIRGRLIHLMTILETLMREYCNWSPTRRYRFEELKKEFIKNLKINGLNKKRGFNEFLKSLNVIKPERDDFAHGFVYYEKRSNVNFANNFLVNRGLAKKISYPHFDPINDAFEKVFDWLKKNNLLKISGYSTD